MTRKLNLVWPWRDQILMKQGMRTSFNQGNLEMTTSVSSAAPVRLVRTRGFGFVTYTTMKLTWKFLLLAIIFSLPLALVFTHILHRPSNKIISQWKQSDSINYKSFGPYFLSVVERDVNWTYFPLNWERHYEIYVGNENGVPVYGHFIEFSFHPGYDGIDAHMKKSTVEWTEAGVIFKEASGHVLFIPKDMFIGGR